MNELMYCIAFVSFYGFVFGAAVYVAVQAKKIWETKVIPWWNRYQERAKERAAVKLRLARSHR